VSYGLPPRPELPEDELAALAAAAEEVLRAVSNVVADDAPSWRFSGRWFNAGPFSMRRPQRSS
jgi:hypothetical protein